MANVAGPRSIMRIGYVTINGQKHPVEVERSAFQFFEDLWLRTGGDDDDVEAGANAAETAQAAADTAQAAADAAEASAEQAAVQVQPLAHTWWTDGLGAWPVSGLDADLVITFTSGATEVATHTVRGTLDSGTGNITAASQATTGEATTITFSGNGTSAVVASVTHTNTSRVGSATFTAQDISAAGNITVVGYNF